MARFTPREGFIAGFTVADSRNEPLLEKHVDSAEVTYNLVRIYTVRFALRCIKATGCSPAMHIWTGVLSYKMPSVAPEKIIGMFLMR